MSARTVNVQEVVGRYAAGFFPLYDPWGRFYWERLPLRAVLPVTADTLARALRMKRRAWKILTRDGPAEIRYSSALPRIITHLQDERIKENSWVRTEVVRIYNALHAAGLLQTIELWQDRQQEAGPGGGTRGMHLVGGLLGLVLPGTFIAETMFSLVPEASKICVCQLVEDCWATPGPPLPPAAPEPAAPDGPLFQMIDVQTPHDRKGYAMLMDLAESFDATEDRGTAHPCVRLGEQSLMLNVFMRLFTRAWKNAFTGGVREWMEAAAHHRAAPAAGTPPRSLTLSPADWRNARHMLRFTLPSSGNTDLTLHLP